jgi:EAL domain-containing protein (putative c-di-GMP-specific phosphodiesterase class I)
LLRAAVLVLPAYWIALLAGADTPLVTHWLYLTVQVIPAAAVVVRAARVREHRFGWGVLGLGFSLWTLGSILQVLGNLYGVTFSSPGPVDALWLTLYPCALITFSALGRSWMRHAGVALASDTLTVMLVTAAAVTACVLPQMMANQGGLSGTAQIAFMAYPIADCVLLTVALVGAVVAGREAGLIWRLLGIGVVTLVAADILWALQAAAGTWQPVMGSNAVYPIFPTLAALAAWRTADLAEFGRARANVRTHSAVLVAVVVAVALLTANEWTDIHGVSVVLAALGLLAAVQRTALALTAGVRASLAAGRERDLVDDVRAALEADELDLHFQPLVDTRTGAVRGAEALLRWAPLRPDQFLPAVERSDLIGPLTDWVLDRALAASARWDGLAVSVNLATANLAEPDLPARVLAALRRHGLPTSALTLEITETAALSNSTMADQVLAALDEAGVALSIDDFGTGHSSLARIARFPISEVKIDRSFVRDMHDAKLPIVPTTIELARALGLRVVAEGIEDAQTLQDLRALGCDLAQGYYLSRPLCEADFTAWLDVSNSPVGVTDLSEERDPCSKSRDSQSGSAASPRCTTRPSRSATGASAG